MQDKKEQKIGFAHRQRGDRGGEGRGKYLPQGK
jgi:hypothetical protein